MAMSGRARRGIEALEMIAVKSKQILHREDVVAAKPTGGQTPWDEDTATVNFGARNLTRGRPR